MPAYEKDDLDRKIIEHFPGKIVRKDLTSLMKRGAGIPTYVLEYLLGMYCATDDEAAIRRRHDAHPKNPLRELCAPR